MATKPLAGRTALVTGASRGVGRGIAIGLAELGACVLITGRVAATLETTAELVRAAGGTCETHVVDHADDAAVRALFSKMRGRFDATGAHLDIVVNSAYSAISFLLSSLEVPAWEKSAITPEIPDADADPGKVWDLVNGVGLRGNFVCTTLALRQFAVQGSGVVVNVSSLGSLFSTFEDPAYGIGKAGVERLTAEFARAAPPGVTVFSFCPGIVDTKELSGQISRWEKGTATAPNEHNFRSWNLESPLFVGRTLAKGLARPALVNSMQGHAVIAAELAKRVGVRDEQGKLPLSLRSLRYNVIQDWPWLASSPLRFIVPDWRFPMWMLMQKAGMLKLW